MAEALDVIDAYLNEYFQISLEQVLVDASIDKLAPRLVGSVEIACQESGCFECPDLGKAYHFEGAMAVAGKAYRYRSWIYEDHRGERCVTDLKEFTPVNWATGSRIIHSKASRLAAACRPRPENHSLKL